MSPPEATPAPPPPPRRLGALRKLLLALAGLLALLLATLPLTSRRLLESRLSGFFHRRVSVAELRYRLFPLTLTISGLRVAGATDAAPPFLEARRVEVLPGLGSLPGRLSLRRLRIDGLRLRIHAFPGRGDDIPKMGSGSGRGGGPELRVQRLILEDGEVFIDHERVPLELDLPEFRGRLAGRHGELAGGISFGEGRMQFGTAPPLVVGAQLELSLEGRELQVESGRIRFTKSDLGISGSLRLQKDPLGLFQLSGALDLDELDRHVSRTGFGMKGDGRFQGTLSVDGPRLRFKGRLEGTAGEFDGVPVPRFAGDVAKDERGTHIRNLEIETLGGRARLDVEIPPGPSVASLDAQLQGVDAEGLAAAVFDIGTPGVSAAATGEVSIRWPRGRIRYLSGTIGLALASGQDGRTPLSGRFDWSAKDGVQRVLGADLRTPATWARLSGTVQPDDRADLALDAESADLAASDDLVLRLRRALGAAEARLFEVTGSGGFRGRWRGTLQVPLYEGRFSGQQIGYLGVVWGRAEWAGSATPDAIESHSLVLRRDGSELWLDGRLETGPYGESDAMEVRGRLSAWPVADFVKALEWDLDLAGPFTGEFELAGRRSAPVGTLRVGSPAGRYYGIPFSDLDVDARLAGSLSQVRSGRARVGGGGLSFRGSLSDDAVYDGEVALEAVDVGDLLPAPAPDARWGGRVSGRVTLQGALERPRLSGRLSSPRLFLGDEGLGALALELSGAGDGGVRLSGSCRSPRLALELEGSVGAAPPYVTDLVLGLRDTSLDPILRVMKPGLPVGAGLVASGEVRIGGPASDPRALRVAARLTRLDLLLADYRVRNNDPVELAVDSGRLDVGEFHLAGEGTDLAVSGSAALLGDGPLDLSLRGAADLRALSAVTRRLRGRGAARVAVAVSGTRDVPQVDGLLEIEGGGLRVRGFPHGLEDVYGSVRFGESAASFEGLKASLGGGEVTLDGQATYRGGTLLSFDVRGSGRGLALRYPEGLRSVIDADLRLYGDAEAQWLTGSVDVRQAAWTRRYDVASELLAGTPGLASAPEEAGSLRYDVKLRAPGTLRIDNNLATLTARAELSLAGRYGAPSVLGRAEVERGRVYFQGQTYVIRRGTLDFANPQKIDPLFDIEAETRVRSYRVTLKMNGTLERVYPSLSSDPPLSAVQILNLLAGGDETAVAGLAPTQAEQARLAATGAATLAAGRLSEEVGLERGAERLFGLNRFSIDPSVVKGGVTNPTARLTVGKRITPDLSLLYSVDLRGAQERILSVEYTLSDRFSLLFTSAEPNGLGFDVRLRQSRR